MGGDGAGLQATGLDKAGRAVSGTQICTKRKPAARIRWR